MAGKRLICFLLSLLLLGALTPVYSKTSSAFDLNEHRRRSRDIKKTRESLHRELKQTEESIVQQTKRVDEISRELLSLSRQIDQIASKIQSIDEAIIQKEQEINLKQTDITEKLELFRDRVRVIYMGGETNAWEIILGATSFADFFDRAEIISKLSQFDSELVADLKHKISAVSHEKDNISAKKVIVADEKQTLLSKKKVQKQLLDENHKLVEALNGKKVRAQGHIDEANREYQRIQDQISEHLAEKARQAALARRKALEEKRRQLKASGKKVPPSLNDDYSDQPFSRSDFVWPVPGFVRLSSSYNENRGNYLHRAIDICGYDNKSIYKQPVVAIGDGEIISSCGSCQHDYSKTNSCGCGGGYGNYVTVAHDGGKASLYGHLSSTTVHSGQRVKRGQVIGYVGSTGHSTGPHLHFETIYNGKRYNPLREY